jgi:hypothetical protein
MHACLDDGETAWFQRHRTCVGEQSGEIDARNPELFERLQNPSVAIKIFREVAVP